MENLTVRELMFLVSEIDETRNPFAIAIKIMKALKTEAITPNQYDLLCGDLKRNCDREKISYQDAICSLF
jgi:hypothetical protein